MVIQEEVRKLRDIIEILKEKLCTVKKGAYEVQEIQRVIVQEEEGISKDLERCDNKYSQKEPEITSVEDKYKEYYSKGDKATKKSLLPLHCEIGTYKTKSENTLKTHNIKA